MQAGCGLTLCRDICFPNCLIEVLPCAIEIIEAPRSCNWNNLIGLYVRYFSTMALFTANQQSMMVILCCFDDEINFNFELNTDDFTHKIKMRKIYSIQFYIDFAWSRLVDSWWLRWWYDCPDLIPTGKPHGTAPSPGILKPLKRPSITTEWLKLKKGSCNLLRDGWDLEDKVTGKYFLYVEVNPKYLPQL